MPLGFFKKRAQKAAVTLHKVENRDFMEAIIAASMLVSSADGEVSNEELTSLDRVIQNHDALKHFGSESNQVIDKFADLLTGSGREGKVTRLGKLKLMNEIKDIKAEEDQKIEVFLIALDIAEADGEIDAEEMKMLREIGKELGISVDRYLED